MITTKELEERHRLMRLTKTELVDEVLRLQKAPKDVKELREQVRHLETDNERLNYRMEKEQASLKASVQEVHRARNFNETRNVEEVANLRGQIEALERMTSRSGSSCASPSGFYQSLSQEQLDRFRKASTDHTQQLHNLANRVTAVEEGRGKAK